MDRGHLRFQSRTSHWAKLTARFIWVMEPFSCYRVQIYIPDIIPRFCNPNSVPLRMLCPLYSGSKDAKWRNWPSGHALWSLAWIESSYLYSMTMTASVVCMGACSPFLVPGHIFTPPTHIHTHTHLQTHLNTYISSTSTTSTRTCWTSRSSRTSRS